jgi:calcineurin-like phosphoesterase family protein
MCNRPYRNVEEMNIALINNHNSIVTEEDITIHLGDFIWKGLNFDDIVYQLNGFHIFVKGNHDKAYPNKTIALKNYFKYEIKENQIFEFEYLNKRFVACHYPFYPQEWNGGYRNIMHFYGHVHKELASLENIAYHVGVDTNNWHPVNVKNFIK